MATWFTITFEGEPTEADFERVAELAAQGYTSGQLINDETDEDEQLLPPWQHGQGQPGETLHAEVLFYGECRLDALSYAGYVDKLMRGRTL